MQVCCCLVAFLCWPHTWRGSLLGALLMLHCIFTVTSAMGVLPMNTEVKLILSMRVHLPEFRSSKDMALQKHRSTKTTFSKFTKASNA
eukprot:1880001-Amphidinium_carterae.1